MSKVEEEGRMIRSKYSSAILKFKCGTKFQQSKTVSKMIKFDSGPLIRRATFQHRQGPLNKSCTLRERMSMEQYIVDDDVSSLGSDVLEDEFGDYASSIINLTDAKAPEDLVDSDLVNLLKVIKSLAPARDEEISLRKEFGEVTRHKTIVFDLDETLVQSQHVPEGGTEVGDFQVTLGKVRFGVTKRPYMEEVLTRLGEIYELAVFTAAEQTYADAILERIDPEKRHFGDRRLYRQHCVARGGPNDRMFVKDLRVIVDRELSDMLIVDNSILSFAFQLDNGVPICSFYAGGADRGQDDQELLYLLTYLEDVYHQRDLPQANGKVFKLSDYLNTL